MSLYSWLTGRAAPPPVVPTASDYDLSAPGLVSAAAPPLPEALRRGLPAYAAYRVGLRTERDVLIHIVGGAHVLPNSARDAAAVAEHVGLQQGCLGGVLLELCAERGGMLNDLLGNPAGINGPPLPIPTLGTIALEAPLLLIDPLFWVTLPGAAIEAIVRGRMGAEQAAAARVAQRLDKPVLLCDQLMSTTKIRAISAAFLAISPWGNQYKRALRGPWSPPEPVDKEAVAPPPLPPTADAEEGGGGGGSLVDSADRLWSVMRSTLSQSATMTESELAVAAAETEQLLATLTESSDQTSGMITSGRIGAMVHQPLIEERDAWLAFHFLSAARRAPNNSALVAVVGAAHVPGVSKQLARMEQVIDDRAQGGWPALEREMDALHNPWSQRWATGVPFGDGSAPAPALLDETSVAIGGIAGLLAASLVPTGISFMAWRHVKAKARSGNPTPLMWFKRLRVAGIGVFVAGVAFEVTIATQFVSSLRNLQLRWNESAQRLPAVTRSQAPGGGGGNGGRQA